MAKIIFLVGFMGSGKSSLGRRLAVQEGMDFVDTDREIERSAGMRISEIFELRGEEWFRELEAQVTGKLAGLERDTVVALGGGSACREGVMETLGGVGTTVYLKMAPDRLVARIDRNGRDKRPKIKGMDDGQLLAYIGKLLPEREIYYNKATFVLDCGTLPDGEIIGLLTRTLKQTNP